jgi:hypothetical protein
VDLDLPEDTFTKIITCTIEGILEVEDLHSLVGGGVGEAGPGQLTTSPRTVEDPSNLKRLRERHIRGSPCGRCDNMPAIPLVLTT